MLLIWELLFLSLFLYYIFEWYWISKGRVYHCSLLLAQKYDFFFKCRVSDIYIIFKSISPVGKIYLSSAACKFSFLSLVFRSFTTEVCNWQGSSYLFEYLVPVLEGWRSHPSSISGSRFLLMYIIGDRRWSVKSHVSATWLHSFPSVAMVNIERTSRKMVNCTLCEHWTLL